MADRGFLIHDLLPPGVSLNIPPFLCSEQFTTAEALETESIAKARVHIDMIQPWKKMIVILSSSQKAFLGYQKPVVKEIMGSGKIWVSISHKVFTSATEENTLMPQM